MRNLPAKIKFRGATYVRALRQTYLPEGPQTDPGKIAEAIVSDLNRDQLEMLLFEIVVASYEFPEKDSRFDMLIAEILGEEARDLAQIGTFKDVSREIFNSLIPQAEMMEKEHYAKIKHPKKIKFRGAMYRRASTEKWIVTKDYFTRPDDAWKPYTGKRTYDYDESEKPVHRWRLYDDDRQLMLEGKSTGDIYCDPLDAFMYDIGVTYIKYQENSKGPWEIVCG